MGCSISTQANGINGLSSSERAMNGRKGVGSTERIKSASHRMKISLGASSAAAQSPEQNNAPPDPKLNKDGKLAAEEVAKRRSGSVETKEVILGDMSSGTDDGLIYVRYAALTQRGYYPEDPHKENQDTYVIYPSKFGSGDGDALFVVFDGHGEHGHSCSNFAKQKLPTYMSQNIKKARASLNAALLRASKSDQPKPKGAFHPSNWPVLPTEEYESVCRQAHIQCNKAMHDDPKVKDTLSGTTSISVAFHAGRMTVCNVGDSRAVLGHRNKRDSISTREEEKKEIEATQISSEEEKDSKDGIDSISSDLVAIPLSEDQTPYRKDERERLKKAGARICSLDQMEGFAPMHDNWGEVDLGVDIDEEGDPPRVWCQDHDFPGTAFSRSIGDSIGEDIGVFSEPEMLTKAVTEGDEILVIGSDGIFEFLTNQKVIDICSECKDPLQACTRLLEASYQQWINYELRTDDITCIVLFMKCRRPDDNEVMDTLIRRRTKVKSCRTKTQFEDSDQGQIDAQ